MSDEQSRGDGELIRVLIADDQALFRRGLYVVLGTEDHIEVVAEAENGEEAIQKASELAPDVVLMGLVGEYLSRVYAETKRRPRYVVRATHW